MKFIAALNAINGQVWAFLILITGCAAVLSFHKAGIDIGIAAGVIGVAGNMFTSHATPAKGTAEVNATIAAPTAPVAPAQP
jgi:hypothetical protein